MRASWLCMIALVALPVAANAQHPRHPAVRHKPLRGEALADSIVTDTTKVYHLELGVDVITHNDSLTDGKSARAGYLIGKSFTAEVQGNFHRTDAGIFDATVSLGLTAALLPGDNSLSGKYVEPLLSYHYQGGPAQMGVGLEVGARVLTGKTLAARASVFTIDYLRTKNLPTITSVGAKVGMSFWR